MPLVFDYTEYRAFLRDWIAEKKASGSPVSYRGLGNKLGIDPGFLVHILHENRHTTEDSIPRWVKVIGFNDIEAQYFGQLILFNRAKSPRDIQQCFQRLCELRDLQLTEISDRQYRYYLKWQQVAIRVLLLTYSFRGDYADLARRLDPPIPAQEAEEVVNTLLELKLVAWNEDGVLEPTTPFLSTSRQWQDKAVHEFQTQTLQLAQRSLKIHRPQDRQISTLTLAIPAAEMGTLQEMAREFQQKVLRWTASLDDSDSVIQVNVAMFPLSSTNKDGQA